MTRLPGRYALISIVAAIGPSIAVLGQKSPAGPEFQVSTHTVSVQRFPAAAAEADGDFVIAWDGGNQDGSSYGVFARRFSRTGVSLATEFQVNTVTVAAQRLPSVAIDADGDFVIAWRGSSPAAYEVFLRRFSSGGTPLTSEIQANTYTPDQQLNPAVASEDDGDFVVTWFSLNQDGASGGIFARRFSSAGTALAGEFQVNAHTTDYQSNPSVSVAANGNFVVAWESYLQDGADWGVFARSFSSAGAPLTGEIQINAYTVNVQRAPSVAVSTSGQFVVAWHSRDQDAYHLGVFARRFSSSGAALANEFQISAYTTGRERNPSVAVSGNGDFIVAWDDSAPTAQNVFARRFSSAGDPLTGNFLVNTYTPDYQIFPSVAASGSGDFVVAWESQGGQDGDGIGVFAQRFATISALDVDGNGTVEPLTDGLLVLRALFGFTGDTLVAGAIDAANCTRCTSSEVEDYIPSILEVLDIDGDGEADPLTDGLLVLRYLFGFRGAVLSSGAVDTVNCTRCTSEAIEGFIDGLL